MSEESKARWTLLEFPFIEEMVKAMEFGARKYTDYGWKGGACKGKRIALFWNAGIRHMVQFLSGEKVDKESGLSHLAHAACNMMMLWYHEEEKNEDCTK